MVSLPDYEKLIAPARERFAVSPAVKALQAVGEDISCELLLIYFCALGVQITAPVEGWIRRAANRCTDIGFAEVGGALRLHACAEVDHHMLMIADLRLLAAHWNARHPSPIDADSFLGQARSPGAAKYCRLHEDTIASPTPFLQVAIEYEIEKLPLRYGEAVAARCVDLLGSDVLSRLGFLTQHMVQDVGHTELNARTLAHLIEQAPWCLAALVAAGTAALNAYAEFLDDCVRLTEDHARKVRDHSASPRPALIWRLELPPASTADGTDGSGRDWLETVRSLRGKVLFDNGRRPVFKTSTGGFQDPDPVDSHAFHILAYDGSTLVGCVRLYPLRTGEPPGLAERFLDERHFSEVLRALGTPRTSIAEIGRWTVDPDYRARSRDLGLGLRLTAAAAALARMLQTASGCLDGLVICAAGTTDRQDAMLERVGLTPVPGIGRLTCVDYDDDIRLLYGSRTQRLSPHLEALVDEMIEKLALREIFDGANHTYRRALEDVLRGRHCNGAR